MEKTDYEAELGSVRSLMDRSTNFIPVSGLSVVMAGAYSILGSVAGYFLFVDLNIPLRWYGPDLEELPSKAVTVLSLILVIELVLAVATAIFLTLRKAARASRPKEDLWKAGRKGMIRHMLTPLISGGILMLLFLYHRDLANIPPSGLIFYGVALVAGSLYTVSLLRYLGFCQIILGLFAAANPELGLVLWATGFGIVNVLFGLIIHFRFER